MPDEATGQGVVMLSGIRQGVPVLWHEAVAVVLGLARWAGESGPDARVPDLEHVGFSPSGEVFVFPGGKTDANHVRALSSLLLTMLADGPAPEPLVEMATPRASGAVGESLDDFVAALRFFQRPNPAHDVQTLASRIDSHLANLAADKQFAVLQKRVTRQKKEAEKEKPAPQRRRSADQTRGWLGRAVAVVAVVALAGSAYYFRHDLLQVLAWARSAATESAAPAEPAADSESKSAPATTATKARPSPAAPLPAAGPVGPATSPDATPSAWSRIWPANEPSVEAPNVVQPAFATIDFAPPAPLDPNAPGEPLMPDLTVYTQADEGVTPPALRQPQLPSAPPPGLSDDEMGVVELLVNEEGLVERVRLVSPMNRYRERMLLSAFKAWMFTPAMRDGRPVKYLTRVRVTI